MIQPTHWTPRFQASRSRVPGWKTTLAAAGIVGLTTLGVQQCNRLNKPLVEPNPHMHSLQEHFLGVEQVPGKPYILLEFETLLEKPNANLQKDRFLFQVSRAKAALGLHGEYPVHGYTDTHMARTQDKKPVFFPHGFRWELVPDPQNPKRWEQQMQTLFKKIRLHPDHIRRGGISTQAMDLDWPRHSEAFSYVLSGAINQVIAKAINQSTAKELGLIPAGKKFKPSVLKGTQLPETARNVFLAQRVEKRLQEELPGVRIQLQVWTYEQLMP